MAEFVFQMIKARKSYGDRVILDDVTLSFLPGAKIGVVGPNGMGKSTLLKIMAGLETVSNGEASLTPGFTVGILQQEPPLDDTKTVGENIKMAFGPIAEKVARFNEIGEEMANPDADFDALMDKALASPSSEEANKYYQQGEELLAKDLPNIPLWYMNATAVSVPTLKNVSFGYDNALLLDQISKK